MIVNFSVFGTPKPQGSKKASARGGRIIMRESAGQALTDWRTAVSVAANQIMREHGQFPDGPLAITITFRSPRPKARTRKHHGWRTTGGDLDKLTRSTWDGIVAGGLIIDDSLIVLASLASVESTGWTGADVTIATVGVSTTEAHQADPNFCACTPAPRAATPQVLGAG